MLTRHQVTFCVTYYAVGSACVLIATALLPRTQTLRLSSFSFPWSIALRHQSRAFRVGLCAKYEAPEEVGAFRH